MKSVIKKAELLNILKTNRENHRGAFFKALDGYFEIWREEAERIKILIKERKPVLLSSSYPMPKDQTRDYDRAIKMVEMTQEDTITLEEEEFGQLVLDQWYWKQEFRTSNSRYWEKTGYIES